jgi:hypothetical protein
MGSCASASASRGGESPRRHAKTADRQSASQRKHKRSGSKERDAEPESEGKHRRRSSKSKSRNGNERDSQRRNGDEAASRKKGGGTHDDGGKSGGGDADNGSADWQRRAAEAVAGSACDVADADAEVEDFHLHLALSGGDIAEEQSIQAYDMDVSQAPGEEGGGHGHLTRRYSNSLLGFNSQSVMMINGPPTIEVSS